MASEGSKKDTPDAPPESNREGERTQRLIAELEDQLARSRRQLAAMWCGLEDARLRRTTPGALPPVRPGQGRQPQAPADVLVVDDDPDLLRNLCDVLQEEGYSVASVPGAPEALAYLRENPRPAAIVLDLMMPHMSGAQLLERLDSTGPSPPVPVIVFTAARDAYVKAAGMDPTSVVHKPFLPELLQRLETMVRRRTIS